MVATAKARVFMSGRSQHVTIPAEYRFSSDEVYVTRDAHTGALTLSEQKPHPSMEEIFAELDAAGAADFELERDPSPPREYDWL